jgi:hypothetical protein
MPDDAAPTDADAMTAPNLDTSAGGWRDAATGQDVFRGRIGYAWFRCLLPDLPTLPQRIHFDSVDDNAVVYLNGKRLFSHLGWNAPFDVPVRAAWKPGKPNILAILVQNTASGGGIMGSALEEFDVRPQMQGGNMVATLDPATGGLITISNRADTSGMNWIHPAYLWGTGWLRIGTERIAWQLMKAPRHTQNGAYVTEYQAGPARITVWRRATPAGRMNETYKFTNAGPQPLLLPAGDIGIQTPFNDNYTGGAPVCLTNRCNAHIWCGGTTSYVCAIRMGGAAPHLGLALTQGSLAGYSQDDANSSDDRGLLSLNPAAMTLKPGQSQVVSWTLFWDRGWDDFFAQASKIPAFIRLAATQYTVTQGDTTTITATGALRHPHLSDNGHILTLIQTAHGWKCVDRPSGLGDHLIRLTDGKVNTLLRLFVTPPPMNLIRSRVLFIVRYQQRNAPGTPLDGAYLVYDNDTHEQIYQAGNDHDAGRERVGMGCLVARYLLVCPDPAVKRELRASLDRYYAFINRELTDDKGVVYNDVGHEDTGRLYNYPLVAELHLLMFQVTQDPQCLQRFARTIRMFYSRGGDRFYCIGLPVTEGLAQLKAAGMTADYQAVLAEFTQHADMLAANGVHIPTSEVSYEQSIVAPAVQILTETYRATHRKRYLQAAESLYPLMVAFNGQQPDYHLNDIAIRHWDDYWFGKARQYGDTFPHYWSTITAISFHDLAMAVHNPMDQSRAEKIVSNNLCLFRPDGSASCAYIDPLEVDGKPGQFFDAWANDQDWAMDNYLVVNGKQ